MIAALVKSNDENFISFANGLHLKSYQKEALNIKLVKVILFLIRSSSNSSLIKGSAI